MLSNDIEGSQCHIVYRLGFANVGFKSPTPDLLCVPTEKFINADIFYNIFPFSFAIATDMTIDMGGSSLVSTLGKRVLGKNVREIFTLRRPKAEFTWQSVCMKCFTHSLSCKLFPNSLGVARNTCLLDAPSCTADLEKVIHHEIVLQTKFGK